MEEDEELCCRCEGVSTEKRRIRPPQRLDTEDGRNADDAAEPPVGVTTPDEGLGEESYSAN